MRSVFFFSFFLMLNFVWALLEFAQGKGLFTLERKELHIVEKWKVWLNNSLLEIAYFLILQNVSRK